MAVNSADPSVATVTAVGLDVAIAVTEVDVDDKKDEEAREAEVVEERVVDDRLEDDVNRSEEVLDCAVTRLTRARRPEARDLMLAGREANSYLRKLGSCASATWNCKGLVGEDDRLKGYARAAWHFIYATITILSRVVYIPLTSTTTEHCAQPSPLCNQIGIWLVWKEPCGRSGSSECAIAVVRLYSSA